MGAILAKDHDLECSGMQLLGHGRLRARSFVQHSGFVFPGVASLYGCRNCTGRHWARGIRTLQTGAAGKVADSRISVLCGTDRVHAVADLL